MKICLRIARILLLCLLIVFLTACVKQVPLKMAPFGTLDQDDYKMLHEVCSKQTTTVPDATKIESQMPYVVYYIKMPSLNFAAGEFKDESDITSLCKLINDDQYGIKLSAPIGTIEWLNALISTPDLYDKMLEKKKGPFSVDVQQLVQMTNSYRKTKKFVTPTPLSLDKYTTLVFKMDELNDYEKSAILKLNRLLLEELYPDKAPKCLEKERAIDWNNITVAIPDFKTLDNNISEAEIKESCDYIEKYFQKWKVFKKIVRTVTPDTDIILEGIIVRYHALGGKQKAVQFLLGGLMGSRSSKMYAYCFLEMKWIDARSREKIGVMMVNYAYPTTSMLERGRPHIFLVDSFNSIFTLLMKSRAKYCSGYHWDLSTGCGPDHSGRGVDYCEDIMDPKKWTGK